MVRPATIATARTTNWTGRLSVMGSRHARYSPALPGLRRSVALAQRALDVAALVTRLDRLALVEAVLAARQRDLDLRARPGEVDARRHQREAALHDPDR